jgi:hypothetical protein
MRLDSALKERARHSKGSVAWGCYFPSATQEFILIETCVWIWKQDSHIRHPWMGSIYS